MQTITTAITANETFQAFINAPATQFALNTTRSTIKTHNAIVEWLDAPSNTSELTNRQDCIVFVQNLITIAITYLLIAYKFVKAQVALLDQWVQAQEKQPEPVKVQKAVKTPAKKTPTAKAKKTAAKKTVKKATA